MATYTFDIETFCPNEEDVIDYRWNAKTKSLDKKYSPFPLKEQIICISLFDGEKYSESYDLRYLMIRSLVNNIKVKNQRFIKHIDLRTIFNGDDKFAKGTLRDFSKALGIEATTENGTTMRDYYLKEDFETIEKHNKEDVKITWEIYQKAKSINLL